MKVLGTSAEFAPLEIGIVMSNLPLLVVLGIVSVVALCALHAMLRPKVARSTFVVVALGTVGLALLGYVSLWAVSGQRPDFDLAPTLAFGLTTWVSAAGYAGLHIICKRSTAPSK